MGGGEGENEEEGGVETAGGRGRRGRRQGWERKAVVGGEEGGESGRATAAAQGEGDWHLIKASITCP